MRIASAEVVPYALPFKAPYATARGTLDRREMVLLRVRDDDGLEGLGEAVPLSLRGGEGLDEVVGELRGWAEVVGELRGWAEAPRELTDGLSAPARCAVRTALLDLEGRGRGLPLWRLLDAARAQPVRCNATLTAADPVQVAQQALDWQESGFATFKLKLGAGDDAATVRAVRQAVGAEARIRVDANGAWDLETAAATLRELEGLDVELAEQPVATLGEMAELRPRTSIPLSADESVATPEDAREAARVAACDLAAVKLSKTGDPDPRPIAAHLPVYLSSALDGPVGIAAAAHAVQLLQTPLAHGLATQRLFAETIASVECELRDGMLHPPPGPGLGVEIDEAALDGHRL